MHIERIYPLACILSRIDMASTPIQATISDDILKRLEDIEI